MTDKTQATRYSPTRDDGFAPMRTDPKGRYVGWSEYSDLLAMIAEKDAALRPFAAAAHIKLCGEWRDDQSVAKTDVAGFIMFGDIRRARAAFGDEE